MKHFLMLFVLWMGLISTISLSVWAAPAVAPQKRATPVQATPAQATVPVRLPPASDKESEKMKVEVLRQKYWDKGDMDSSVVQNRLYSKSLKGEFDILAGITSADPFLSIKSFGGLLGFHFSEFVSVNVLYLKLSSSHSAAWDFFVQSIPTKEPTVNAPSQFLAGELGLSPIYGKLSLAGKAIIHYDLHLLMGAGQVGTQNGSFIAPSLGIGQKFHLNKWMALRFDYRYFWYTDTSAEKEKKSVIESVNFGLSFLFG